MISFIPAIDLRKGKVVRLWQGKPEDEFLYSSSPLEVIKGFESLGIELVHIVDLDGAIENTPQRLLLNKISKEITIGFQWAGGVRSLDYLKEILESGAKRVIISTKALEDRDFLRQALNIWGAQHIGVSIDVKEGSVFLKGWKERITASARQVAQFLIEEGCKNIVITDIKKDGTLEGVDTLFFKQTLENLEADFYLAGGISSYKDLVSVKEMGLGNVKGVIVGRAIYEKKIDPLKALKILREDAV